MERFYVIGGEYADMSFSAIAAGKTEERHGPFPNYGEAFIKWQERARATIDDCQARFRIVSERMTAPA